MITFSPPAVARLVLAGALVLSLPACSSVRSALGVDKRPPDEFAVVTKAPLIIPPDFSLRPPTPGAPRPQELQPTESARLALVGEEGGPVEGAPSAGEMALLRSAKADRVDPNIRSELNSEAGGISEKNEAFADTVINAAPGAVATSDSKLQPPTEEQKKEGTLDENSASDNDAGTDEIFGLFKKIGDIF